MKSLIFILALVGTTACSGASDCCKLSTWAQNHMDVVKLLAEQFKQVYNAAARRQDVQNILNQTWSENFANSIGKSKDEVNDVIRKLCYQIVDDMHSAELTYGQVARPNYFEARAGKVLEELSKDSKNVDTNKKQIEYIEPYVPESVWAKEHIDVILSIADKLKQTYSTAVRGQEVMKINHNSSGLVNLANSIRKNNEEAIVVLQKLSDQIVEDVNAGRISFVQVDKPNYFEAITAAALEPLIGDLANVDNNQKQIDLAKPIVSEGVSSSNVSDTCCNLSPWANEHIDLIHSMAVKLKQAARKQVISNTNQDWSGNFTDSIEESKDKINSAMQKLSNQIINDMFSRRLSYEQINRPNFFDAKVAEVLEKLIQNSENIDIQQQDDLRESNVSQNKTKIIGNVNHYSNSTKIKTVRGQTIRKKINKHRKVMWKPFAEPVVSGSQNERLYPPLQLAPTSPLQETDRSLREDSQRFKNEKSFSDEERENSEKIESKQQNDLRESNVVQNKTKMMYDVNHNNSSTEVKIVKGQTIIEQNKNHWNNIWQPYREPLGIGSQNKSVYLDPASHQPLAPTYPVQDPDKNLDEHSQNLTIWQQEERYRLQRIVQTNELTTKDLQNVINKDQTRLYTLANTHQVGVEEIVNWWNQEVLRLQSQCLLKSESLEDWQKIEQEQLIQLAKQQKPFSLIEFEEKLTANRKHLDFLANQYHYPVHKIEDWIKKKAERLKNERIIGDLKDWQKLERSRIHEMLKQSNLTIEEFQKDLKKDHSRIKNLANQYHVTVEEVEEWIRREGRRLIKECIVYKALLQLDLISDGEDNVEISQWQDPEQKLIEEEHKSSIEEFESKLNVNGEIRTEELQGQLNKDLNGGQLINLKRKAVESAILKKWQTIETKRLQTILTKVIITKEELLEFIESDSLFQNNLTANYEVSPQELFDFQSQALQVMQNEGLLEVSSLKHLENWQQNERDHLYYLIRIQCLSSKDLPGWQTDIKITNIAASYKVLVSSLKKWQMQEMKRIENLAKQCKMSPNVLEDFRFRELKRLQMIAHKDFLTETTYNRWSNLEDSRMKALVARTGLSGVQLDKWRRKLYLLAQGLIDLDFNENGYEMSGASTLHWGKQHNDKIDGQKNSSGNLPTKKVELDYDDDESLADAFYKLFFYN